MITIAEERLSEEFSKSHLNGLPFNAAIHHFTGVDKGSPHCHPFKFTSHVLSGGYIEKVFYAKDDGSWTFELIHRLPGTAHTIEATHIHQIVELPAGECHTIILPQEKTRDPRFWRFDENGYESRIWYEGDFI